MQSPSGFPPLPSTTTPWARPEGPPVPPPSRGAPPARGAGPGPSGGVVGGEGAGAGGRPRGAAELERSLRFVQAQHAETLRQLHGEVELLRRQNRDLHYKLIMHPVLDQAEISPSLSPSTPSTPRSRGSLSKTTSSSARVAKEQSTDGCADAEPPPPLPKKQPKGSRAPKGEEAAEERSARGHEEEEAGASSPREKAETPSPEHAEGPAAEAPPHSGPEAPAKPSSRGGRSSGTSHRGSRRPTVCDRATSPIALPSASEGQSGAAGIPAASSNPFLVNVLPSHMRKPPTLEECEVVIRQLWNINHMQMQELMYLRSCLEDIHRTRRIPEEYMLAGQLGHLETPRLPRMKNAPKACRTLTPLPAAERAVLPALKQTLGNAFAERQKRTQAVQRKRLRRTAL